MSIGWGRLRQAQLGVVDQVVSALSNAATTALAAWLLRSTAEAGAMMLAVTVAYVVVSINRAFVGDVLLAHAARRPATERDQLVRDGTAAALVVGSVAAVGLLIVWALTSGTAGGLSELIWVAPALPAILVQDTGRYAAFVARRPQRALVLDGVWVLTQAALVAAVVLGGRPTAGALLGAWGAGAVVAAAVGLLRERVNPLRGRPRRWLRDTRQLSGWFTATAVLGQLQVQLVAFLVAGTLGSSAYAQFRLAQTAIVAPGQNLVMAAMGLLVPRSSRLAAAGDARALRHQTRMLTGALACLGVAVLAAVVTLTGPVLHAVLPRYAAAAVLAPPMGVQAGIYLVQIPYATAMRGMHHARRLLLQYGIFSAASVAGLLIGTHTAGLVGAAWGLCAGAAAGLAAMIAMYRAAVGTLIASPPTIQTERAQSASAR